MFDRRPAQRFITALRYEAAEYSRHVRNGIADDGRYAAFPYGAAGALLTVGGALKAFAPTLGLDASSSNICASGVAIASVLFAVAITHTYAWDGKRGRDGGRDCPPKPSHPVLPIQPTGPMMDLDSLFGLDKPLRPAPTRQLENA